MRLGAGLLCFITSLACAAEMPDRVPVASVKPLLIAALERGEAQGLLVGPAADAIHRRFKTESPIEIDVTRISPLDDANCGRLDVLTREAGVIATDKPEEQSLRYQISYCRDGRFPARK